MDSSLGLLQALHVTGTSVYLCAQSFSRVRLLATPRTVTSQGKIYINDPLSSVKNISCGIEEFQKAWEQMGNQAVVILD